MKRKAALRTVLFQTIMLFLWIANCWAVEDGDRIVITAEDIEAMQALKMADVLNHAPGVQAGDSSVSIHGSYKVKVFLDGRPINDPSSSHGGVNWDLVSPDDVERIEILRGKGGLSYGQDASGGVVLITTKTIKRLQGNVRVYGGNYNTQDYSGNGQMTVGKLGIALNGGYDTTDGYKINNDSEQWRVGTKLAYPINDQTSVAASADYVKVEGGQSGTPSYPTPYARKDSRMGSYALQARFFGITGDAYYNEGRHHNTDKSKGLDSFIRVSELGENVSRSFDFGTWGSLNCGAGFRFDQASGNSFEDQSENALSFFAAQSFQWPGLPVSMTAGLRTNINSAFDNSVNPEARIAYERPKWSLSATYSRSDNTPSFLQRYRESSSTRPNPNLNMETADNFSVCYVSRWLSSLSASVTFFYNILHDRITYVTDSEGIGQYQNFGKVTYIGGDLAIGWRPHDTVTVKCAYTYMDAKDDETGLQLPAKARRKGHMYVYWHPIERLSVVLTGKYSSKVYRDRSNTITVPAYAIVDVRAEYAFKWFSLFSEMENAFDSTYYYSDGLLAPPLMWIVGVNIRI